MIKEGDIGDDFYIVKSGTIEIFSENPKNNFRKLIFREDYFGESAIVGNHKRLANVKAVTDCSCLVINSNDFKWIFKFDRQAQMMSASPMAMIQNLQAIRQEKDAEFINQNEVIKKLNEKQKCMINMLIEKGTISSGQVLWKKGEKPGFCFLIKSGKFQMSAPQNKVPFNFYLKNGSLVGDFPSLMNGSNALSQVTCVKEGEIFALSKKKLMGFLCNYPAFFLQIKQQYVIN